MKTIEQNNIEMVTAKIEELWNKGDIYQTDQFLPNRSQKPSRINTIY